MTKRNFTISNLDNTLVTLEKLCDNNNIILEECSEYLELTEVMTKIEFQDTTIEAQQHIIEYLLQCTLLYVSDMMKKGV